MSRKKDNCNIMYSRGASGTLTDHPIPAEEIIDRGKNGQMAIFMIT
jgi:hypothetical protein